MPFTSSDKLKTYLGADQVDLLVGSLPAGQESAPFDDADAEIIAKTGVKPDADVSQNDAVLVKAASYIVIWQLTGLQTGLAEEEIKRRFDNYKEAQGILEDVRDGKIDVKVADSSDQSIFFPTREPRWEEY